MAIQDKILKKADRFRRKVYSKKLQYAGNESRVVRLRIEEDRFGDETLITIINHDEIIVNITSLEEVPLSRLRSDLSIPALTSQQSLFLYDILPITIEPGFGYDIEKGDILIKKMFSEKEEDKPFYLVLRITEPIGNFSPHSLIKLEYQAAPYIQAFSQEVIDIINSY